MINSKIQAGVSGRQNLQVLVGGKVVRETGFTPNMILDSWFTILQTTGCGNAASNQSVAVGTGTTAPAPTQTTLVNFLAGKAAADSVVTSNLGIISGHAVTKVTRTFTFAEGAVVGNVSEVATYTRVTNNLNPTSASICNTRALTLNQSGIPTAIPVGAGEQLRVVHETELRLNLTPFIGVFSLTSAGNTSNYTLEMQASSIASLNHCEELLFGTNFRSDFNASLNFTQVADSVTFGVNNGNSIPSGAVSASSTAVSTKPAATTLRVTQTYSSVQANLGSGIGGFALGGAFGNCEFTIKATPRIPKTSLNKLTAAFDFVFTRI